MISSTNNFSKFITLSTTHLEVYMTDDHRMYIIRPTDPINHPNSSVYDLGMTLTNISDLSVPDVDEISYSYQIEYDKSDQLQKWWDSRLDKVLGGGKILASSEDRMCIIPISGEIIETGDSSIMISFRLKFLIPVRYDIVRIKC